MNRTDKARIGRLLDRPKTNRADAHRVTELVHRICRKSTPGLVLWNLRLCDACDLRAQSVGGAS